MVWSFLYIFAIKNSKKNEIRILLDNCNFPSRYSK